MTSLAAALLILFASALYFSSFVDFRKLKAEIDIDQWAQRIIKQGGIGRDCSIVNPSDIDRIFDSRGRESPEGALRVTELRARCWEKMELVEMRYFAQYDVVSGVYRCEDDELVQELQLAIYLEPRSVPQADDCVVGAFPRAWDIPVGEATVFSLP